MTEVKEYVLVSIEGGKPNDFKDQNGNYWATAVFEGIGEPVKVVTPNISKWIPGQPYYGEITEAESKAGNVYLRFKRHDRPEAPKTTAPSKPQWQPKDDSAIQAQWAIRLSTEIQLAINPKSYDDAATEAQAKRFMAMIPRVKDYLDIATVPAAPEELPPVDTYVNIMDEPVNLDDIPF